MPDPQDQQTPDYSGVKLDLSKSQPLPPAAPAGVTLDLSKSKPLSSAAPSFGLEDVRKVSINPQYPNAINPAFGEKLRSDPTFRQQVSSLRGQLDPGEQSELEKAESDIKAQAEGGRSGLAGIATGITKGFGQTVEGLAGLASKVLPEGTIPTGPSYTPGKTPTRGLAETTGELGEGVAEWMAGDEALKGLANVSKVVKNAPHLLEVLENYPKASKALMTLAKGAEKVAPIAKAAVIGGTQTGIKESREGGEGTLEGAKAGALGGAIGGTFAEVTGPFIGKLAKAVGLGTSAEEDIMRAAQAGKRNTKFLDDWATAQPRIAQEMETGGDFKDLKDAAERIGDVRRKIWTEEVMPAIEKHADETLDTTKAANAVRKLSEAPDLKNFPEDKKFLQDFADKYTSGTPLFTGEKTVGDAEKEIERYNAKLGDKGYWKKTPKERAVMEKADPQIAAWRTISDEIRDSLYEHLDKAGEKVADLKNVYGAVGNIENEISGQVNVAARQRPVSLKQMIGMAAGIAKGGPLGMLTAALPIIDKLYNSPVELLNRAVSKSAEAGPIKQAVQKVVEKTAPIAKVATGVAGEEIGKTITFTASDGSVHKVNADQWPQVQKIDPGAKANE